MKTEAEQEFRELTKADRCDRCGAQAWAIAVARHRSELLFCAHHLKEHEPMLVNQKFAVKDYSERLTEQP